MSINTRAEVETSGNRPSLRPLIRQLRTLRTLTPLSPDPLCKYQEFTHGPSMDLGSSTELITLKPWDPGKQLPLGFSVLGQNRKENYELFILDSCTNFSACSIFIYGALGIKAQATSHKQQASSKKRFDKDPVIGYYRTY